MSGADVVYALQAILESPFKIHKEFNIEDVKSKNYEETEQEHMERMEQTSIDNFWFTYDLLSFNSVPLLFKGIELAKETQKAITSQAAALISRKLVKNKTMFRSVVIDSDQLKDQQYFLHPKALTRLGVFLIESHKSAKGQKPIIIAIKDSEKKKYLVAGILGTESQFSDDDKTYKK